MTSAAGIRAASVLSALKLAEISNISDLAAPISAHEISTIADLPLGVAMLKVSSIWTSAIHLS